MNLNKVTVANLKEGEKGIIQDFDENQVPVKLMEMGCLPGNVVELLQRAPLKDPLYINANGSHIVIRLETAANIPLAPFQDAPTP